ncbi:Demethylspheroidene O-methyltransferase [Limihaloglobus sulfuriphilus]|uniref:Demethylspheroidene O-methyltransferase n=1 Tax=Limihaloglobus sulfuriphilus TaxID=1851148 RepID=A0A1Q2MIP9_9BACT|nr:methyltransferase [Limihaloglobus sulfuriphilus]AQQ72132.1 Demethylspheroidene O-methyltransferase [Limihaloglobus sulfuriphilus]
MDDGFKYIHNLTWGYRAARTLQTAVRLGVFTKIADTSMDTQELAEKCGANYEMLERLLIGCASLGFLERRGGRYSNTAVSRKYLVEGGPLYQGDIICHSSRGAWDAWDALPDAILVSPAPESPQRAHRDFIMGMDNITRGGRGGIFLDNIDLRGRELMFDIGGGPRTYSILACGKYTKLKSVIFDIPETIKIARQVVKRENMDERIAFREGSWDSDDFGSGADTVLMSNILHGKGSNAAMKLEKAYKSLKKGGLLVIQEFILDDAKTGPIVPALFNIMVGAYALSELIELIEKAGFTNINVQAQDRELGSCWLTAEKPADKNAHIIS